MVRGLERNKTREIDRAGQQEQQGLGISGKPPFEFGPSSDTRSQNRPFGFGNGVAG